MTNKFPLYFLVILFVSAIAAGCNTDSEPVVYEGDYGNCSVTSFSLTKDDSVLTGLDSVFFSIDLLNGEIFNADSLPKGTDVSKLVLKIGTNSASGCDLTYRLPGTDRDTTISYIKSPEDSINFADGPVKLVITSYDGQSKRQYSVKVNVHDVEPDTLYWDQMARRTLPGNISSPTAQKTVEFNGEAVCLTASASGASVAMTNDPYAGEWRIASANLPAEAIVNSFTASSDAFYILDSYHNLYTSSDALAWTATGEKIDYIYGGYGNEILGARRDADGWKHVTYPASTVVDVPSGCPVEGAGQIMVYETKWSVAPMAMFVGGKDAAGNLVGSAWCYDGNVWAKISNADIDERENVALFPYFTPRVNTSSWRVTERSVLIAVGGAYEETVGEVVSKSVYVSYDMGLNWDVADSYLQLPEYIPGFANAQALVFDTTLSSRSMADEWKSFPSRRLPAWMFKVASPEGSRVTVAPTEWECPYIYLFGGEDAAGHLYDTLWRGVITRLTFQPLY